ncbi:MAG: hypothetical protein ACI87W_000224 [Halieaceae bacterium]
MFTVSILWRDRASAGGRLRLAVESRLVACGLSAAGNTPPGAGHSFVATRRRFMNKYLAIIDAKACALIVLCIAVTYCCYRFDLSFNLNITLFSIAVIFPLVFTIREAFKRRDNALKFLSLFKASMGSVHFCFEQCTKLNPEKRAEVARLLHQVSASFFEALGSGDGNNRRAEEAINEVFYFIQRNRNAMSAGLILKIIRFIQDVNDGMENTISLKMHGTPISMRAYCLVFVFIFPFIFVPTIVHQMEGVPVLVTYLLSVLHGFILIALYNVQSQMENPFDQIGLDDIKLEEYRFREVEALPLSGRIAEAKSAAKRLSKPASSDVDAGVEIPDPAADG